METSFTFSWKSVSFYCLGNEPLWKEHQILWNWLFSQSFSSKKWYGRNTEISCWFFHFHNKNSHNSGSHLWLNELKYKNSSKVYLEKLKKEKSYCKCKFIELYMCVWNMDKIKGKQWFKNGQLIFRTYCIKRTYFQVKFVL